MKKENDNQEDLTNEVKGKLVALKQEEVLDKTTPKKRRVRLLKNIPSNPGVKGKDEEVNLGDKQLQKTGLKDKDEEIGDAADNAKGKKKETLAELEKGKAEEKKPKPEGKDDDEEEDEDDGGKQNGQGDDEDDGGKQRGRDEGKRGRRKPKGQVDEEEEEEDDGGKPKGKVDEEEEDEDVGEKSKPKPKPKGEVDDDEDEDEGGKPQVEEDEQDDVKPKNDDAVPVEKPNAGVVENENNQEPKEALPPVVDKSSETGYSSFKVLLIVSFFLIILVGAGIFIFIKVKESPKSIFGKPKQDETPLLRLDQLV